jgi:hypothetical protein
MSCRYVVSPLNLCCFWQSCDISSPSWFMPAATLPYIKTASPSRQSPSGTHSSSCCPGGFPSTRAHIPLPSLPTGWRNGFPCLVVTQPRQHAPQAIIVGLHVVERMLQQLPQGMGSVIRPCAYGHFAMVGLRQNVGQPPHGQLAIVQPLLQPVCPHLTVEHSNHLVIFDIQSQ